MVISGRALSYNTLSADLGGFKERLQPGCFAQHLKTAPDVLCRREHETGFLLGRTKNGTLTLQDGPDGLDFRCTIDPKDPIAVSTRAAIQSGLIDSMSFAFSINGDDGQSFSAPDRNGLLTRTITRAILLDVAPVASPAYPRGTSVSARSADYGAVSLPKFIHQVFHTRMPRPLIDQRNRERLNAITRQIVTDPYSNEIIEDFELDQRAERIARIIERDELAEQFAELRRELGE
jgi:HK97 family phage prohead protease